VEPGRAFTRPAKVSSNEKKNNVFELFAGRLCFDDWPAIFGNLDLGNRAPEPAQNCAYFVFFRARARTAASDTAKFWD
jgi:hypothetical protein